MARQKVIVTVRDVYDSTLKIEVEIDPAEKDARGGWKALTKGKIKEEVGICEFGGPHGTDLMLSNGKLAGLKLLGFRGIDRVRRASGDALLNINWAGGLKGGNSKVTWVDEALEKTTSKKKS